MSALSILFNLMSIYVILFLVESIEEAPEAFDVKDPYRLCLTNELEF